MRMSRGEPSGRPRRVKRALLGGLALGLLAAGCAKAVVPPSGAITSPTGIRTHQASPTGTASSDVPTRPRPTATSPRPHVLVAVTTAGTLQSLDPSTGHLVSSLASGATGDEVSLTPDHAQVFFENTAGCFHQI